MRLKRASYPSPGQSRQQSFGIAGHEDHRHRAEIGCVRPVNPRRGFGACIINDGEGQNAWILARRVSLPGSGSER